MANRNTRNRRRLNSHSDIRTAAIEACEARVLLSTFMVSTTSDSGSGSLRQAILDANSHGGADLINFRIPGTGVPVIHPLTPLPIITDPLTINGYSQTGSYVINHAFQGTLPPLPPVQISGDLIGSNTHGALDVQTHDSVVTGLIINQFGTGPAPYDLQIGGANNRIEGNFLGTGATGEHGFSSSGIGVYLDKTDSAIVRYNLISAQSTAGIWATNSSSLLVQSNVLGLDLSQTAALSNGAGIDVFGGSPTCQIKDNTVCGTVHDAISSLSSLTTISGNLVGVTFGQTAVFGNAGYGIFAGGGNPTISGNVVCGSGTGGIIVGLLATRADVLGNAVGQTFGPGGRTNKAGAGTHGDGITINAPLAVVGADLSTGNDVENSTGNGITLNGPGAIVIGNLIGMTAVGAHGNGGAGIQINGKFASVGPGPTLENLDFASNVIGGNAIGVAVHADNATVKLNVIGESRFSPFPNGVGVDLQAGANSSIQGNVICGNRDDGITIEAASHNNFIFGNSIGVAPVGRSASVSLPNGGDGIRVLGKDNQIGGVGLLGNVIAANGAAGVYLAGTSNLLEGNFIGTDSDGNAGLGNAGAGVYVEPGATGELIGGNSSDPTIRNVICGNHGAGIFLDHANDNTLINNLIGVTTAGAALGNDGAGILITGSGNLIGPDVKLATNPTDAGANLIAFNKGAGVNVAYDSKHAFGTANRITGNSIYSNGGLGIDVGGDGVTPNDAGDSDSGPNDLQNYPVLTSAFSYLGHTRVVGTFSGSANTSFYLDFYASPTADPSGFGEGKQWIGDVLVSTDSSGNAAISALLPNAATPGWLLSATATDKPGIISPALNPGSTSEFSNGVTIGALIIHIMVPAHALLDGGALGGVLGTIKLPFGLPHGVSASVSWGDGSTSTAKLSLHNGSSDTYDVLASHIYQQLGKFTLTITLLANGKKVTSSAAQSLVSPAVGLLPGRLTQPPAMTLAQNPTLAGTVLEDVTLNIQGIAAGGAYSGTVEERVLREDSTGTLDFYFRVSNNASSLGAIQSLAVSNFAGFSTTVGYRTDGVGDTALSVATRSSTGSTITLNFAGGIKPGHSSYLLLIRTNATHFNTSGQVIIGGLKVSGQEPVV